MVSSPNSMKLVTCYLTWVAKLLEIYNRSKSLESFWEKYHG